MILSAVLVFVVSCAREVPEETLLFERAEASYTLGDYDGALAMYRLFLDQHALSPLAPIAEQRVQTIERELDAIMGRRGAPAPVYASPFATSTPLEDEPAPFRPVRAPTLPTLER